MIRILSFIAVASASIFFVNTAPAANASGPVRGVWFEYVNTTSQDFDWTLDQINQAEPSNPNPQISSWAPNYSAQVVSEIKNMLSSYQAAGVNYISIMIDPTFMGLYCQSQNRINDNTSYCYDPNGQYPYPAINPRVVVAVENFLNLTNSGPFAGNFKIELAVDPLSTKRVSDGFWYVCESAGGVGDTDNSGYNPECSDNGDPSNPSFNHLYGNAEEYIYNWLTNVVTDNPGNNVGMALLGVQWDICNLNICDGDSGESVMNVNNGEAIKKLWAWEQSTFATNFPGLTASYETIATNGTVASSNTTQMTNVVRWTTANTPGLPYLVGAMYIQEAPGAAATSYATDAYNQLVAFADAQTTYHTTAQLWIQEFGASVGTGAGGYYNGYTYTIQDQENAINGTLLGMNCQKPAHYPRFVWVTGNDYNANYPSSVTFGLINGFTNDIPAFQPGWQALDQWYSDAQTVSSTSITAPTHVATNVMLPGTCPATFGDGLEFSITTAPVHGTVSVTDTGAGTFTYTSNNYFWGTDSFQYQWSYGSPATTVNVTVYSVPVMTTITNTIL